MTTRRIVVCGLGKVGAALSGVLADSGFDVTGLDLDSIKVEAINGGRSPIEETDLPELMSKVHSARRLRATTVAAEAIRGSDACIFITPTPSLPDGSFSNELLLAAIETVAREVAWDEIAEHQPPKRFLFAIASTVTPTTCDDRIVPLLKKLVPRPWDLVYIPQFIALGTVIRNLKYPDFYLIGAHSEEAADSVAKIFHRISPAAPIKKMSLIEAELAKISLNCFVTMKISFANQLAMVATEYGADPQTILDAIGTDRRIGHCAFKAGLAFGGPCFPRDNHLFQYIGRKIGVQTPLALSTDIINDRVIDWIVGAASIHEGDVGILGTAYKPGTPCIDESPGLRIAAQLGRPTRTHDPLATHSHSLEEVLECRILIVATAHPEYESLAYREDAVLIDPMHVIKTRIVRLRRREKVAN
jgi:UDPglucose 6-dehydrogenase